MDGTPNSEVRLDAVVSASGFSEFEAMGLVEIDDTARVGAYCSLNAGAVGRITIQEGANVKSGARLVCYGGHISIGKRVSIGENTVIYGHGDVFIGDQTAIGPLTFIGSQDHIQDTEVPLRNTGEVLKSVRIGAGVIVSAGCQVLGGVEIGSNSFIGGSSLVMKSLPPNVLAAGSPCKVLKPIDRNPLKGWSEWSR